MTTTADCDRLREDTKVVISPIDWFTGARHTRRTWRASLATVGQTDDPNATSCPHSHGHKTIDAAKQCGVSMWKKLA